MLLSVSSITFIVILFSTINIREEIILFALLAFFFSICAVIIDIILDSFRVNLAEKLGEHSIVSAMYVFGYRLGMFIASAGAIFLSIHIDWILIYKLFSLSLIILISLFIALYQEPNRTNKTQLSIKEIILQPWNKFKDKNEFAIVILFIFLYKLADQFMMPMLNPFLFKHIGYDEYQISLVVKTYGFFSSILGSFIGGYFIKRFEIKTSLICFALIHTFSNILYIYQNYVGYDLLVFRSITIYTTVTSGMCMTAYIAYIASMCGGNYSGTQYAFFSSLIGASRVLLPTSSGTIVDYCGWNFFFVICLITSIPGILLIKYIPVFSKK